MDFSVDAASISSQVLVMLLVASMLDPWARGAWSAEQKKARATVIGSLVVYLAKVGAMTVLLFNMQVVLFDRPLDGATGAILGWSNYGAIFLIIVSLLVTMITHFSRRPEPRDDDLES